MIFSYLFRKSLFIIGLFFMTTGQLHAGCCAVQEAEVVNSANIAIAKLSLYNTELDMSLSHSKTAVQEAIAITLEKERFLNYLFQLKENTHIRSDVKALIARQILLHGEAATSTLQKEYGDGVEEELNKIQGDSR